MTTKRPTPPVWMMGLSNSTFGFISTFTAVTVPQILAAQGVPGGHIAEITALMLSPGWWAFLFAPMLDVHFRRRTYAIVLGMVCALSSAFVAFSHHHLLVTEIFVFTCSVAATFYQSAVGGWMGSLIRKEQDSQLSAWFISANMVTGGLMAMVAGHILLYAPPLFAAGFMFSIVLLPMALFFFIPAPPPDKMLAAESFGRFSREVLALLKRRRVLLAMALFVLPSASFSLTNVLAGIGKDYHADPDLVGMVGGVSLIIGGTVAGVLVPQLAKKISLRPLYLAIGFTGAFFTLSTLLLPRAPWTFVCVFMGEMTFQAVALTTATAVIFEVIGQDNPLASTTFTLLTSVMILPISYMGMLDGWGYDYGGLVGGFVVDACLGLAACTFLAILLRKWLFAPHPVSKSV